MTESAGLPPRAALAMLTLKLRAAEQEAIAAEAEEAALDHEAARRDLRARLDAMIEERRQFHASAYATARATLAAEVDAARRVAEVDAARRATEASAQTVLDPLRLIDDAPGLDLAAPTVSAASAAMPSDPWSAAEVSAPLIHPSAEATDPRIHQPTTPTPGTAPAPATAAGGPAAASPATVVLTTGTGDASSGQPVSIVLDAEVLGKVFAKVFSAMLDERLEAWARTGVSVPTAPRALPAANTTRRALRHLRHPDVVLMGIASAIVIGVLVSWFT